MTPRGDDRTGVPLVKGGQGREDRELKDEARALLAAIRGFIWLLEVAGLIALTGWFAGWWGSRG